MNRSHWRGILALIALLWCAQQAHAVFPGQLDSFQNGTTSNWQNGEVGNTIAPMNVVTGGPLGAGDRYLRIVSDGSAAGGKLTVFNREQWLGEYPAQGITTIEVDLRNEGNVALSIRLAFKTGPGTNGVAGFLTQPMLLPVGSGWQHFSIAITPGALIPINNPGSWASFFVGEVRFVHQVGATNLTGSNVIGQLGIDNIRAVPEPATTALLGAGLLALGARCGVLRRRRRAAR
jgi:hypothetical protein